jgi:hypothetical protein
MCAMLIIAVRTTPPPVRNPTWNCSSSPSSDTRRAGGLMMPALHTSTSSCLPCLLKRCAKSFTLLRLLRSRAANSTDPGAQPGKGGTADNSWGGGAEEGGWVGWGGGGGGKAARERMSASDHGWACTCTAPNARHEPTEALPVSLPSGYQWLLSCISHLVNCSTGPTAPCHASPWLPAVPAPCSCRPAPHVHPALPTSWLWHSRCLHSPPSLWPPAHHSRAWHGGGGGGGGVSEAPGGWLTGCKK